MTSSPVFAAGVSSRIVPRCRSRIRCTIDNPSPLPGARVPGAVETTTDVRALVGWNAEARISDGHPHVGGRHLHVHVNLRTGSAVPDGVVDHVPEENREEPRTPDRSPGRASTNC